MWTPEELADYLADKMSDLIQALGNDGLIDDTWPGDQMIKAVKEVGRRLEAEED